MQLQTIIRPSDLVDFGGIYEFYADGIACVQDRGADFRTIFFAWEEVYDHGGCVQVPRIIAKVIRPKHSILRGVDGIIAKMLAAQRHEFPRLLHS